MILIGGPGVNLRTALTVKEATLGNWLILMEDPLHRGAFEAGIAAAFMFFAYFFNEKILKKHVPEGGRVFFAPMAALVGLPIAAVLAAVIPGLEVKELCAALGLGGLATHGVHALGNKISGKVPPNDPPGSPGDTPSHGGS